MNVYMYMSSCIANTVSYLYTQLQLINTHLSYSLICPHTFVCYFLTLDCCLSTSLNDSIPITSSSHRVEPGSIIYIPRHLFQTDTWNIVKKHFQKNEQTVTVNTTSSSSSPSPSPSPSLLPSPSASVTKPTVYSMTTTVGQHTHTSQPSPKNSALQEVWKRKILFQSE
jgi:hypothetical protein